MRLRVARVEALWRKLRGLLGLAGEEDDLKREVEQMRLETERAINALRSIERDLRKGRIKSGGLLKVIEEIKDGGIYAELIED